MANYNLSDAAKQILGEDSKSTFDGNIKAKMGMRGTEGTQGQQMGMVGKDRLMSKTAYGTNDAGEIGQSPERALTDELPDYLKGTPGQATPPGATPPIGSEKDGVGINKLSGPQETMGRKDIAYPAKSDATPYETIRDRIAGKLAPQMFQANPGATFQSYGEETEYDDESLTEEEKMMKMKMMKKEMMHNKMKEKMKEDIDALLSGENLSEEFVTKATTIFEAAVIARAEEVIAEAEEELIEEFEIAVETIKEELASKVDDYLNYMVEEWMQENQLAIESGLRSEVTEDFISGLRNLFVEHYIDIPEDKVDIIEELTAQLEETEQALNEQIHRGIELSKELNEQKKLEAIYTACEGLSQTQVEKLKSLAESVEFTTEEEFVEKLEMIRESYFSSNIKSANNSALDDEVEIEEEKLTYKSSDNLMEAYSQAISKTLK
jgi:hypothetical protein